MPAKVTARMPIIQVRVVRAFFHSGGLKAGTPSEIASTPVSAAQPELKARRMMKSVSAPVPASASAPRRRFLDREAVERVADEADREHDEDADQEEVGRHGEDAAGLPDAAQVEQRHQRR